MTADRVSYQAAGWHFTCAAARAPIGLGRQFIALAKREPFVNFHLIYEPGEVWFEFGASAADALAKLTAEVAPQGCGRA